MNRLKEKYVKEIVPSLKEKNGYKSVMQVPKLDKIVINIGAGDAAHRLLSYVLSSLLRTASGTPCVREARG